MYFYTHIWNPRKKNTIVELSPQKTRGSVNTLMFSIITNFTLRTTNRRSYEVDYKINSDIVLVKFYLVRLKEHMHRRRISQLWVPKGLVQKISVAQK